MHLHRTVLFLLFAGILASCSKKETTATSSTTGTLDTTQKAESVAITDTNHHLMFHPKVGSVQRYHIIDKMSMSASDAGSGGTPMKHSASSTTEFYLHHTVKSIGKDSSVDLVFQVDSIQMTSQRDTETVHYSSTNPNDAKNDEYREFNILLGKNFTIRTNKYGDLDSMLDVSSIVNELLVKVPDTDRTKPIVRQYATEQAEEVANAYVMRVLVHDPIHALKADTTWRDSTDMNLDVAPGLSFPVHIDGSETVRGLEKRGDRVLAVLEDNRSTTPRQRVLDQGPAKATIDNFVATSHSVVRIEDGTGLLVQRLMQEKRNFTLVVESKQHPGEKRSITQTGSEELMTELLP